VLQVVTLLGLKVHCGWPDMTSTPNREATMNRLPDPMTWLRNDVPLTLLIDLLDPTGPASQAIFNAEDADLTWTAAGRAA